MIVFEVRDRTHELFGSEGFFVGATCLEGGTPTGGVVLLRGRIGSSFDHQLGQLHGNFFKVLLSSQVVCSVAPTDALQLDGDGLEVLSQLFVEPTVQERIGAHRKDCQCLEQHVGKNEVRSAHHHWVQLKNQTENVPRSPTHREIENDKENDFKRFKVFRFINLDVC